ncbi:hypothetical protein MSG28_014887 [Choristoneura fumiferana]|uniref:Uncharacterized protein n=1 Tax=Choristoneura fumiferana TaxID=7141 RepID=A0ACC0KXL4_CHOFU|nr:hypothetical protein MSG28_014887 [Choristoneura fumiferana]
MLNILLHLYALLIGQFVNRWHLIGRLVYRAVIGRIKRRWPLVRRSDKRSIFKPLTRRVLPLVNGRFEFRFECGCWIGCWLESLHLIGGNVCSLSGRFDDGDLIGWSVVRRSLIGWRFCRRLLISTMRKTHIVVALGCIFQLVTARTLKNTKVDVNYYETNKAVENKLKEIDDLININDQAIEELEHDYLKNNKGVTQTAMENGSIDELDDDESFDKVNETENERKKEVSPPPGSRRFRRWAMARPCANGFRKVYLGKHSMCMRY